MQPIALAFKNYKQSLKFSLRSNYKVNPFTGRGIGELMVIHQCLSCGKLSPNRIAGDDNEYQILSILKESINLNENLANRLRSLGLELITTINKEEALISLFGVNYKSYMGSIEDLL